MGGACGTCGVLVGKAEPKRLLEEQGDNIKIDLQGIKLRNRKGGDRTGLIWLRIGTSGGLL
jgi:hypothetical protein